MIVFASDLDNTLIYSYKSKYWLPVGGTSRSGLRKKVLVEEKEGKALSYMTEYTFEGLKRLDDRLCFVPVTTRSLEQYRRIVFPAGEPKLALAANGGILLTDGRVDGEWYRESQEIISDALDEMEEGRKMLLHDPALSLSVRLVDGLFLFAKSSQPEDTVSRLRESLNASVVSVLTNGEKVYVIPNKLDKGRALVRLRNRLDHPYIISSGDSLFDIPLLIESDAAVFPEELDTRAVLRQKEGLCVKTGELLSDAVLDYLCRIIR